MKQNIQELWDNFKRQEKRKKYIARRKKKQTKGNNNGKGLSKINDRHQIKNP